MHKTHRRGSVAEAAIALAAIRQGFGVFRPQNEGERYDMILDLRPRLVRVQCKAEAVGVNWADDYDFASLPLHWRP
jgi:hypothetical protein